MNRLDWVVKISARVLKQHLQSLEDYIDDITTPGVPLDPIALLVFARMYKIHIAIFTAKGTVKIETPATVPETLPHKKIVPMLPPGLKKELKTEIKTDVGNRHSPELKPVLVRCETPVKNFKQYHKYKSRKVLSICQT